MRPIKPVGNGENSTSQALARRQATKRTVQPQQIQRAIREALIQAATGRIYRDAFSSPSINEATISLTFDIQSGDLLPEGAELRPNQQAVTLPVRAIFDANVISLDYDQVQGLRSNLRDRKLPTNVRTIIQALLDLDGKAIRVTDPVPQLPAPQAAGAHPDILPEVSPETVKVFAANLSRDAEAIFKSKLTTFMPGLFGWELDTTGLLTGSLTVDSQGSLIATELFRPSPFSPKAGGTPRRTGIQIDTETRVPVVLYYKDLIYFDTSCLANMQQHAILRAMEKSGEKARLEENPYLLDFAFNRGVGGLLLELSLALSEAGSFTQRSIRLALFKNVERGYCFKSVDSARGTALATIEVNVTLEKDTSVPLPTRQHKRQLNYQVIDGSLPQEVVDGLEFLKARGALSTREILGISS